MRDAIGFEGSRAPRRRRALSWLVLGGLSLLAAASAWAQTGDVATVEVRFWAFSSNPQFYAYQTTNHHGNEVFYVGQAGAMAPVYEEAATRSRSVRDILTSREMRDSYGWNSSGTEGTTSPSGTYAVNVRENGPNLSVTVQQGINAHPLGVIARLGDGGGRNFASWEVKQVMWSDNESVVVIVLHQALGGEWPVQVDTAHGFMTPGPVQPAPTQGASQ
jgi:hypothetical protein